MNPEKNNIFQLRSKSQFQEKLADLNKSFTSKSDAVTEINSVIDKLLKIRQYRYNMEEDIETIRNIALYKEFLKELEGYPDWKKDETHNFFQSIIISIKSNLSSLFRKKDPVKPVEIKSIPQNNLNIAKAITKKKEAEDYLRKVREDLLSRSLEEKRLAELAMEKEFAANLAKLSKKLPTQPVNETVPEPETPLVEPIIEVSEEPEDEIIKIISKSAWLLDGSFEDSIGAKHGDLCQLEDNRQPFSFYQDGEFQFFKSTGKHYIELPPNSLNFKGDFSVSVRLYIPADTGKRGITIISSFDNRFKHNDYYGFYINYGNGHLNVGMGMTYSETLNFTSAPIEARDRWVHIVVTRKNSSRTRIYIDRVLVSETFSDVNPRYCPNNLAYIGAGFYSSNSPQYSIAPPGFGLSSIQTWDGLEIGQEEVDELYGVIAEPEKPFENIFKKFFKK